MFFLEGRNPNKESYWRVPILEKEKYEDLYSMLSGFDDKFRKLFPRLFSTLSWNNVVVLRR